MTGKNDLIDGFLNVGASAINAVANGVPVGTALNEIKKVYSSRKDQLFVARVEQVFRDFEVADKNLLQGAIQTLRDEVSGTYFDEVWFNSVETANSTETARIVSRALVAFSENKITQEEFWSITNSVRILTYTDVKKVLDAEVRHVSKLPVDIKQRLVSSGYAQTLSGFGSMVYEWNQELVFALLKTLDESGKKDFNLKPRVISHDEGNIDAGVY